MSVLNATVGQKIKIHISAEKQPSLRFSVTPIDLVLTNLFEN